MAHDFHQRLLEFFQYQSDRIQHRVEVRPDVRLASCKGHVAGHVEDDVVSPAGDADAGTLQLRPQLCLLLVHVVAHTCPCQQADARSDGGALAIAAGNGTNDCTGCGTDGRALGCIGCFLFPGIRVDGLAGCQGPSQAN
jgi:hypothetical protein